MVKLLRHPDNDEYFLRIIMEHVADDSVPSGCRHILHAASPYYGSPYDAAIIWPFSAAEIRNAVKMYQQQPWTLMDMCQYCYGYRTGIGKPRLDIIRVYPDFRVVPVDIGDEWH